MLRSNSRNGNRTAGQWDAPPLERVFIILNRSFAMYLADADPWMHPGDERAKQVLDRMIADQQMYAGRVAEMLLDRRIAFSQGEYPMVFTDTHGLGLDYLITELIAYHKQDIAELEQCATQLASDPAARALTEEVLGNARGHLESLEELIKQPA